MTRDRSWFEGLFAQHHTAVAAYARRRIGEEADDVVAEVFTTAWRRREDVPDHPLPWLYRTAAHHVLHQQRSFARGLRLVQVAGRAVTPPEDAIEALTGALDDRATVAAALARLEVTDQELLRLWAWEELDAAAIGYVLGIGPGAVRVRLHRAKRRLRAALEPPPAASPSPVVRPVPHLTEERA